MALNFCWEFSYIFRRKETYIKVGGNYQARTIRQDWTLQTAQLSYISVHLISKSCVLQATSVAAQVCTGLHRHELVLQSTSVSFTDLHSI